MEKCDTLRYTWERLQSMATKVSNYLLEIQPAFKDDLVQNVTVFNKDCKEFYKNYDEVCPSFWTRRGKNVQIFSLRSFSWPWQAF